MILPFFACETAQEPLTPEVQQNKQPFYNKIIDGSAPAYVTNPYDNAGVLHNQLLDDYALAGTLPTALDSIIAQVEALAISNTAITATKTPAYIPITLARANYLLANSSSCLTQVLDNTVLNPTLKDNFSDFLNGLIVVCGSEPSYATVGNYITSFEATIIGDSTITTQDKKLILTTTSIIRHSAFYRRKPKRNNDIDWEFMVTHIVATVEGAAAGTAEAITTSVAISIAENQ